MPLYEIVLHYPDRDEVRVTDRAPAIGETLVIAGHEWDVVLERDPADVASAARFLCELTTQERGRTLAARAKHDEPAKPK